MDTSEQPVVDTQQTGGKTEDAVDLRASSPLSSPSFSPLEAACAHIEAATSQQDHEAGVLPTAQEQELSFNPLFDRDRPRQQPEQQGSAAHEVGAATQQDSPSRTDNIIKVSGPCHTSPIQQAYLKQAFLSTLTATIAEAEPTASSAQDVGLLPPLESTGAKALQERVKVAEQHLTTLCSMLAGQAKSSDDRTPNALKREVGHSFDIMRSISGSCADTTCSEPISPSVSGMATVSNAVVLLLEGHRKQVKAFERYISWMGGRRESGGTNARDLSALAPIQKQFGDMEAAAELVKSELQKLREVSSQQELEVAIQWQEKQALQQKANDEQARAEQVRAQTYSAYLMTCFILAA
jgi:hypothetical protein